MPMAFCLSAYLVRVVLLLYYFVEGGFVTLFEALELNAVNVVWSWWLERCSACNIIGFEFTAWLSIL